MKEEIKNEWPVKENAYQYRPAEDKNRDSSRAALGH
jgi:hypothetical protein